MSDSFLGGFLPKELHHGIKEGNNLLLPGIAKIEKENQFIIGELQDLKLALSQTYKKIDKSCPPKR